MDDQLKIRGVNQSGFGIIPKMVMQDRDLHINSKAIYAYFCSFAGAGSCCFPTRKKICYDLGISNDTLSKYLKRLIEKGYISCEQEKEHGKFSHNVYTLNSAILPCPKISDTEDVVYDKLDTNNNNYNSNSYYNNNNNNKKKEYREEREDTSSVSECSSNALKTSSKSSGTVKGSFDKIIAEYTQDEEVKDLIVEWIKIRKLKKAVLTNRALRMNLGKMDKLAAESNLSVKDYMSEVVMRGWTGFYAIKNPSAASFGKLDNGYDQNGEKNWNAHNNITADEFVYRLDNNAPIFVKGVEIGAAFDMLYSNYPRKQDKKKDAKAFFEFVKENPKERIPQLAVNLDTYLKYSFDKGTEWDYYVSFSKFIEERQGNEYPQYNCKVLVGEEYYETKEEYDQAVIEGKAKLHMLPESCIVL